MKRRKFLAGLSGLIAGFGTGAAAVAAVKPAVRTWHNTYTQDLPGLIPLVEHVPMDEWKSPLEGPFEDRVRVMGYGTLRQPVEGTPFPFSEIYDAYDAKDPVTGKYLYIKGFS